MSREPRIVSIQGASECPHCQRRLRSGSRAFGVPGGTPDARTYHHVCLECAQAGFLTKTPKRAAAQES